MKSTNLEPLNNKKGFTLIELLVVISIIGILSTFGMLSLNGAREKAYDAQIKSDIANIRTTMYMCFDDNGGTYTGCVIPARFKPPICSNMASGQYAMFIDDVNGETYITYANLCAQTPFVFCADHTGFSGIVPVPEEGQTKCKAT
ncbi:MAG: type II secretion system protein [Candidatus Buchananbacteria bacterium]